ncbi:MAG: glutamate racemase [Candidatus Omnitrophica bacterium]|nr:glutamate racemase [Candidatus Omnitrophota bacterium]
MASQNSGPIGVFDSGVGGLTVLKELLKELPHENFIYMGDTARVPYGTKSRRTVLRFAWDDVRFLLRYPVKALVVACNTVSSVALTHLQRNLAMPVIGVIEPAVARAVRITEKGRIGVLGTPTTVASGAYERAVRQLCPDLSVVSKACPLFVPLAEEGLLSGKLVDQVCEHYLKSIRSKRVDTVILGCTHYPLLRRAIAKSLGSPVRIIDSACELAQELRGLLEKRNLSARAKKNGYRKFYVSGDPKDFAQLGERFMGKSVRGVRKIQFG